MSAIAGGGLTREVGEIFYKQLKDSEKLDDAGYVLEELVESSTSKVKACTASGIPYAINYRSTRDPHDLNFPNTVQLTGTQIGAKGIAVVREGWAKLKVVNNNSAIVVGDPIKVSATAGKVDKFTPTAIGATNSGDVSAAIKTRIKEVRTVVGFAEENVAAGSSSAPGADKVLVKLCIGAVGINA